MTLNSISLNFLGISRISDATAAKRMKIGQYRALKSRVFTLPVKELEAIFE